MNAEGFELRLLAIDADGTLVDSRGEIRPAVRSALERVREAGVEVIVCTGRRYRTVKPLLDELGLAGPVVLHNGVLVKDAVSGETLADAFLPASLYAPALELMHSVAPPMVYVDRYFDGIDVFHEPAERCHDFQAEYLAANPGVTQTVASLDAPPDRGVVMISSMADADSLLPLKDRIDARLEGQVQTNFIMNKNYRGHILEITRAGVSKWSALEALASARGIAHAQIAAIGDDRNDTAMIAGAGFGIAMGNAVDEVKSAADHTTESNDRDGVAVAIEGLLASASLR